jgi:hypothetical protein
MKLKWSRVPYEWLVALNALDRPVYVQIEALKIIGVDNG